MSATMPPPLPSNVVPLSAPPPPPSNAGAPARTPGGRPWAIIGTSGGALPEADALAAMNAVFFTARWGKWSGILVETNPGDVMRQKMIDLTTLLANVFVERASINPNNNITGYDYVPILKWWVVHSARRQFPNVVFDPTRTTAAPGDYNLWRGLAVTPTTAGLIALARACRRMLWHLRFIICNGDRRCYRYLISWMAHLVQRPGVQMGVMPTLVSAPEGTGKSIVGGWLTTMIGKRHSLTISDAKHVLGTFNEALEACLFVLANELTFAGNHDNARGLKALLTEPFFRIEPKGHPAYMAANHLNMLLTTNEQWAVPAGDFARRFFVLDVRADKVGDRAYFDALGYEAEHGGLEAFLALLMWRNLSGFRPADFPRLDGLRRQQLQTLDSAAAWVYAVAEADDAALGHPSGLSIPLPAPAGAAASPFQASGSGQGIFIDYSTLKEACAGWCRREGRHVPNDTTLGSLLAALGGKARRTAIVFQRSSTAPGQWAIHHRPNRRGFALPDGATLMAKLLAQKGIAP